VSLTLAALASQATQWFVHGDARGSWRPAVMQLVAAKLLGAPILLPQHPAAVTGWFSGLPLGVDGVNLALA
jgi:hypothetical protein